MDNINNKLNRIIFLILLIFLINDYLLIEFLYPSKNKKYHKIHKTDIEENTNERKTNINPDDEFFQIKKVKKQIEDKNLKYIETITGGGGSIGNALIMLNNLINICENIGCNNIISPFGLETIIKNNIFYKEYNITIIPYFDIYKYKVDIFMNTLEIFSFHYRKKRHEMRLNVIREEVLRNIPKYDAKINDLYIHIRSGNIFVNIINPHYSQPPLCFYKKIIENNDFNKIYILSNGHENPVVDILLKLYPNIIFIHGTLNYDISVIVNAYNFVLSRSTFTSTLIKLNTNLKNLYIYNLLKNRVSNNNNYTIYIMEPSSLYWEKMGGKWKNTKEQLNLMINENCINNNMTIINKKIF